MASTSTLGGTSRPMRPRRTPSQSAVRSPWRWPCTRRSARTHDGASAAGHGGGGHGGGCCSRRCWWRGPPSPTSWASWPRPRSPAGQPSNACSATGRIAAV